MSVWVALRLRPAKKQVAAIKRAAQILLFGFLLAAPGVGIALFPALPRFGAFLETHWRTAFAAAAIDGDPSDPVQRVIAIASDLVDRSAQQQAGRR